MQAFVETLPLDLRRPLSMLVYQDVYKSVDFLKDKSDAFISWICPILKVRVAAPNESIYYENDELKEIYFIKNGSCSYVLPKYGNTAFIKICDHTSFGLIDFVAAIFSKSGGHSHCGGIMNVFEPCDHDHTHEHDNSDHKKFEDLRRRFTVRANE